MTQTLKQATKRIKIPGIEKKHPIKNDAIVKKEKKLQSIVWNFKNNYISIYIYIYIYIWVAPIKKGMWLGRQHAVVRESMYLGPRCALNNIHDSASLQFFIFNETSSPGVVITYNQVDDLS